MNTQFKKGVLELIVLLSVNKKDMYGYELLKRLTNEHYFETYLEESKEGPPRKYYRLTKSGREQKQLLLKEWNTFHEQVNAFIKESDCNE